MNITKTQGTVKKSFEFEYLDTDGKEQMEVVTLTLNRVSHRKATNAEFLKLFENIDKNLGKLTQFACEQIATWDLTSDDKGTLLEITPEMFDELDATLTKRIIETITEVTFPNFQKAKLSPDGSAQTAQ